MAVSRRSVFLGALGSLVGCSAAARREGLLAAPSALQRFVRAAKLATYATQGDAASVPPLLPDSKQLEYRDGEFFYRDIYVGLLRFAGQEVVYVSGRATWSMSYSGGLSAGVADSDATQVYGFLRQALREVPPESPLRGPPALVGQTLRYECQASGTFEHFRGAETVTRGAHILYQLDFSGGRIG